MLKDRYDITVSGRWPGEELNVDNRKFKTVAKRKPGVWLMQETATGLTYELAQMISTIGAPGTTPDWNCRLRIAE